MFEDPSFLSAFYYYSYSRLSSAFLYRYFLSLYSITIYADKVKHTVSDSDHHTTLTTSTMKTLESSLKGDICRFIG